MNTTTAVGAMLAVAGPGFALSAAQDLAGRAEFERRGLFSWDVLSTELRQTRLVRLWNWAMDWRRFRAVLVARFAIGLAAPLTIWSASPAMVTVAVLLALMAVLTEQRCGFGLDGSDQMFTVVLVSAATALVVGPETIAGTLLVWFVAGQLALSYLISGIAKAVSPQWRSGAGLVGVLGTASYSNPIIARLADRHKTLVRAFAVTVIVFECSFWLALVLPWPLAWIFLAVGLAFHLSCAVVMRLNTFFFAFGAAYPAIMWICLNR